MTTPTPLTPDKLTDLLGSLFAGLEAEMPNRLLISQSTARILRKWTNEADRLHGPHYVGKHKLRLTPRRGGYRLSPWDQPNGRRR